MLYLTAVFLICMGFVLALASAAIDRIPDEEWTAMWSKWEVGE